MLPASMPLSTSDSFLAPSPREAMPARPDSSAGTAAVAAALAVSLSVPNSAAEFVQRFVRELIRNQLDEVHGKVSCSGLDALKENAMACRGHNSPLHSSATDQPCVPNSGEEQEECHDPNALRWVVDDQAANFGEIVSSMLRKRASRVRHDRRRCNGRPHDCGDSLPRSGGKLLD